MKVAIMQPYFMPYIGYFQLINAVDTFVIYDDVNYIKQGWINRNNILVDNTALLFTISIINASSFTPINEIMINKNLFPLWKSKFFKTIEQSYYKAPFFHQVFPLIDAIFRDNYELMNDLIIRSFNILLPYLEIETKLILSSAMADKNKMKGHERVINICKQFQASEYINLIGGQKLYSKEEFKSNDINLFFIKTHEIKYKQYQSDFIPNLSILDVLMFNSVTQIKTMLNKYELI